MSSKNYRGKWLQPQFGFAHHLGTSCGFHILQEVGAETKASTSVRSTLPLKKRKNAYRSSR